MLDCIIEQGVRGLEYRFPKDTKIKREKCEWSPSKKNDASCSPHLSCLNTRDELIRAFSRIIIKGIFFLFFFVLSFYTKIGNRQGELGSE